MPSKLRRTTGRVSFLAFLDMITTVTGVLLLITLMLTLYLNNPPPIAAQLSRDAMRKEVEQARARLEADLAALRERQAQAANLTNRVFVVPEADPTGKQPVLIVLSATNGLCSRPGQTNAVEFLARPDHADFDRMLDSWDPARDRLVFYIRPSAVLQFRAVEPLAANRAFSIGYDAAQEDMQYVLASP
ncbi:MAG TPA: hypothetical protein VGO59_18290 [Verrucomicrobiae bacterium]|jgi:hypothetical protein